VDHAPPRGGEEPRLRRLGDAALGPGRKRCREGVGQRVLRRRDIARTRSKIGDELAVALPRGALRRSARRLAHIVQTGRTSTAPPGAAGQRSAQGGAASRSATSRRKSPPSCSFVSAKGPSSTFGAPSTVRTVVAVEVGLRPLLATSTFASRIASAKAQ